MKTPLFQYLPSQYELANIESKQSGWHHGAWLGTQHNKHLLGSGRNIMHVALENIITVLPGLALSIQQPFAWLIVNGHKTVENRTRNIGKRTGPVLIHASARMKMADYEAAVLFVSTFDSKLADQIPDPGELDRGGIVGVATIAGHGKGRSVSPWFTDSGYAYFFDRSEPRPFKPCKGRLGFFPVDYSKL